MLTPMPVEYDEDTDTRPPWARLLGLRRSSDDETVLERYFYGNQTNFEHGFVADDVVLTHTWTSWGLGIEFEHVDLSGYKKGAWWRGLTLRAGPFNLTVSRQRSEEW